MCSGGTAYETLYNTKTVDRGLGMCMRCCEGWCLGGGGRPRGLASTGGDGWRQRSCCYGHLRCRPGKYTHYRRDWNIKIFFSFVHFITTTWPKDTHPRDLVGFVINCTKVQRDRTTFLVGADKEESRYEIFHKPTKR